MSLYFSPASYFKGRPQLPGDKSISHRALLLGALAAGKTEIVHLAQNRDVHSTQACLENLGIQFETRSNIVYVSGVNSTHRFHHGGFKAFPAFSGDLDCGNSGTSLRLLMGILAACPFPFRLVGDDSLCRRPMKRIATPLRLMGAQIELTSEDLAPVWIHGTDHLKALKYDLPIQSAQLKSAILLAGLFAEGTTTLTGKLESRDHTERLLPHFGVHLRNSNQTLSLEGGQKLHAAQIHIPGDLSSAAFWIAAATLLPESWAELEDVSLNPSRIGILNVLKRMGVHLDIELTQNHPEPMGRIHVRSSPSLHGTTVQASEVPSLIDEIPILAILACFAEGRTEVRGAEELRVKETDRINALAVNLRAMGAKIEIFPDGFCIEGPQFLKGAQVDSFHDHRIAMAFSIAALRASGTTELLHPECVAISYPEFYTTLRNLT